MSYYPSIRYEYAEESSNQSMPDPILFKHQGEQFGGVVSENDFPNIPAIADVASLSADFYTPSSSQQFRNVDYSWDDQENESDPIIRLSHFSPSKVKNEPTVHPFGRTYENSPTKVFPMSLHSLGQQSAAMKHEVKRRDSAFHIDDVFNDESEHLVYDDHNFEEYLPAQKIQRHYSENPKENFELQSFEARDFFERGDFTGRTSSLAIMIPQPKFELDDVANLPAQSCSTKPASTRFPRRSENKRASLDETAEDGTTTGYTVGPNGYVKPAYSYSCLIGLCMKNSDSGELTVSEIYAFLCEHFPYFREAPPGWKNSVRHNLSLNKCFQKIEVETPGQHGRKSCLWRMNPLKKAKMDQELSKWRVRNEQGILVAMEQPENLEAIQGGKMGMPLSVQRRYSSVLADGQFSEYVVKPSGNQDQKVITRRLPYSPIDAHRLTIDTTNKGQQQQLQKHLQPTDNISIGTSSSGGISKISVREQAAKKLENLLQQKSSGKASTSPLGGGFSTSQSRRRSSDGQSSIASNMGFSTSDFASSTRTTSSYVVESPLPTENQPRKVSRSPPQKQQVFATSFPMVSQGQSSKLSSANFQQSAPVQQQRSDVKKLQRGVISVYDSAYFGSSSSSTSSVPVAVATLSSSAGAEVEDHDYFSLTNFSSSQPQHLESQSPASSQHQHFGYETCENALSNNSLLDICLALSQSPRKYS